jgi:hypothetical protein
LPEIIIELLHDLGWLLQHGILQMLELVPRLLEVGLLKEEVPGKLEKKIKIKYMSPTWSG